MPSREAWASAYFVEACSDWVIFREFQSRSDIPRAQELHYLQMATEKLAKAHRFRDTHTSEETLRSSQVGFTRFLNTFILSPPMVDEYAGRHHHLEAIRKDCEKLARAVERLAPAVDRENRPGNAEYPWADGERVVVPVEYGFPELSLLREARGRAFLKLVERAFGDFEAGAPPG